MIHLIEQVSLPEDVPSFAKLQDLLLADLFDCDIATSRFLCGQNYFAVGALTHYFT